MRTNPQFPVNLFIFTKKILDEKLHFQHSDRHDKIQFPMKNITIDNNVYYKCVVGRQITDKGFNNTGFTKMQPTLYCNWWHLTQGNLMNCHQKNCWMNFRFRFLHSCFHYFHFHLLILLNFCHYLPHRSLPVRKNRGRQPGCRIFQPLCYLAPLLEEVYKMKVLCSFSEKCNIFRGSATFFGEVLQSFVLCKNACSTINQGSSFFDRISIFKVSYKTPFSKVSLNSIEVPSSLWEPESCTLFDINFQFLVLYSCSLYFRFLTLSLIMFGIKFSIIFTSTKYYLVLSVFLYVFPWSLWLSCTFISSPRLTQFMALVSLYTPKNIRKPFFS